ncbi:MAG: tRNA (adenosine(37)-N6)-threonylcarbamoyltransferase complex ATPase subunit type 1 TsaE [Actinobacteria bacterium]|nr:tRNA (adenosine(37)-N6)-threonylcarbamoyltransferase complex ATPase subunit type 1 TsaE [Actinomycetota bacterium]
MTLTLRCPAEADTRALGFRLAGLLRPGDVVLLAGDLGAGKTVFTSGIAEGLGVSEPVVSPSFVLARRYEGLMGLVHADLYRLGSSAEVDDLDLLEAAADGVLVVEWGEAAAGCFPEDHLLVRLEADDTGARTVTLLRRGVWQERSLEGVVA